MADAEFDLKALCERSGVTPRTVHFYVQQGLLPPAGAPGPGARYREGHVLRLKLIRLLQKQHLPLAEIAKRLRGLTDQQVDDLVKEVRERRASERGSALDYIRGILAQPSGAAPRVMTSMSPVLRSANPEHLAPSTRHPAPRTAHPAPRTGPTGAEPSRSQWERFTLTDGIELNVRRPLSRTDQRQLEKILSAAREIFGPEEEE